MNAAEEKILGLLKGVNDPELMVNIVYLGLVYNVILNEDDKNIKVEMTLTSPGCPMGGMITEDVKELIKANYEGYNIEVGLVWEPAWTMEKLTPEGKAALGRS